MPFQKGHKDFVTKDGRLRQSSLMTGRKISKKQRQNISKGLTGKKLSEEHIENLRLSHLGYKMTQKQKDNISKSCKGKNSGKKSCHWKGDKVGYMALHEWIRKQYGTPTTCEHCLTENLNSHKINWANVSGKYKRRRTDWIRLCRRCHIKYDKQKN